MTIVSVFSFLWFTNYAKAISLRLIVNLFDRRFHARLKNIETFFLFFRKISYPLGILKMINKAGNLFSVNLRETFRECFVSVTVDWLFLTICFIGIKLVRCPEWVWIIASITIGSSEYVEGLIRAKTVSWFILCVCLSIRQTYDA